MQYHLGRKTSHVYQRRLVFMLVYAIIYFSLFQYLESMIVPKYILDTSFDEWLPFIPVFIFPYLGWFPFLGVTGIYFAFFHKDLKAFPRFVKAFSVGIVVFILCSVFFPNGQTLRPVITDQTAFCGLFRALYAGDTTTNIFPSLHVYLGVTCGMAWLEEVECFRKHLFLRFFIHLFVTLIVLSTMFIKAHSVLDVISALFLNVLCYEMIYVPVHLKEKVHV